MRIKARRVSVKDRFWERHLLTSVGLFLILYVVFASKFFVGELVALLFGPGHLTVFGHPLMSESLFIGIGKYGRDGVLGYALYIAISYWLKEEQGGLEIAALIAVSAEILIELFRMNAVLSAVGFPWNLAVGLVGNALALIAVLIHERRLY